MTSSLVLFTTMLLGGEPDVVDADHRVIQGRWRVISVDGFGVRTLRKSVGALWTFEDDELTVEFDGKISRFHFKLDPTTSPKSIDLTLILKDGERLTSQGLYQLKPGLLTICLLRNGMGRPSSLPPKGRDGSKLARLQRDSTRR